MRNLIYLIVIAMLSNLSYAQNCTQGVYGTLTDLNGNPLANQTIWITNGNNTSTNTTSGNGAFTDTIVGVCGSMVYAVSSCGDSIFWNLGNGVFQPTLQCGTSGSSCQSYFTYTTSGNVATFTNQSSTSNPLLTSYAWDFGNGITSNLANPTITLTPNMYYYACLTVTDGNCSDTYCDTVFVSGPTQNCTTVIYGYVNDSLGGVNNSLVTIYVDSMMYTLTTNANGYYEDTITAPCGSYVYVSSNCGDYSTVMQNGFVNVPDFNCNSNSNNCYADFSYQVSNGSIYTYNFSSNTNSNYWELTNLNGNTLYSGSAINPTISNIPAGTYNLCLTIGNPANCQDTYCQTVTVSGGSSNMCTMSFYGSVIDSMNNTLANYPVTVYVDSMSYTIYTDSSGYYVTTITAPCGSYFYVSSNCGNYTGVVTSTNLNIPTFTCSGPVSTPCQAQFSYQVSNGTLTTYNYSTGNNLSYDWYLSGQTSSLQNPTFSNLQPGTYGLCLTVYNSNGCQSTQCDTVIITNGGNLCTTFVSGYLIDSLGNAISGCNIYVVDSLNNNMVTIPVDSNGYYSATLSFPCNTYLVIFSDCSNYRFGFNSSLSQFTASFLRTLTTSIASESKASMSVYPNPGTNFATIELSLIQDSEIDIVISNQLGQVVSTIHKSIDSQSKQSFEVNTTDFAPGFYIISIKSQNNSLNQKWIKQ